MDELKVFTGNAHPALAQAVTEYLDISLGRCEVFEFSNENIFVRILDNVRQRDTFVIQPLCSPVNKSLVELLIMIDALKRASAGRITAVVPYYGYGISGGTDNHLILVDLTETGVTGKQAEESLGATGIVVNRNVIPFDPHPPLVTSGIRLGTPAVTTRGFGKEEMKHIASLIVKVISNIDNLKIQNQVRQEVNQICSRFPVPGIDD